jgi:probable selenium-dependent hydroxylase accessory protein YqeC
MREFKAPGPDEPAVPAASTLHIPVVSVNAVGAPLDEATVHRPERVGELTGAALGTTITPALVGQVLAHEGGGLKNRPSGARVVPIVNKADDEEERAIARDILETAFDRSDAFEYGLVTSHVADYLERVPA